MRAILLANATATSMCGLRASIRASRSFPPVEFCRGTSPSQAEKSRPRRKLAIGGEKAWIADAVIGPTPGMLISRLASSSWRALVRSLRSNSPIVVLRPAICPSRIPLNSRTASGRPEPGFATADASRATCAGTLGGNDAEFRQMAAQRVDRLRALANQQISRAEQHPPGLLPFRLHGDKSIVGRDAASQIASASASSFLWRLT